MEEAALAGIVELEEPAAILVEVAVLARPAGRQG